MAIRSGLPRKQRKALYNSSQNERHRRLSLSLSRELRARYGRRSLTARKGDTVRVLTGSFKGREERVTKVDYKHYRFVLDNVTVKKADGKQKQLPIAPAHLMLTKLNLADPWRRRILKVTSAEEAGTAEELPTPKGEPEGGAPAAKEEAAQEGKEAE
jgi:large subunit ribosomal protein L24